MKYMPFNAKEVKSVGSIVEDQESNFHRLAHKICHPHDD